jgi:imidazole glycerol-phosphate synthase subunit HisH
MIIVVDYDICNLKSVAHALELFGEKVLISNKKEDLKDSEKIVLPGVGAFSEGMGNLKRLGLIEPLTDEVMKERKPFLGICLGMQLLATSGFEGGMTQGLNWIPGEVRKLNPVDRNTRVPHMGWDEITVKQDNPFFPGLKRGKDFYFAHSFHFTPSSNECVVATCDYAGGFVAAVQKDNIFATQFHPEKSQENGLKLLENFLAWDFKVLKMECSK